MSCLLAVQAGAEPGGGRVQVSWIVMFFLVSGGALAQFLLPGWWVLGQAKWPFLAAVVLYYALSREPFLMAGCALVAGLVQDALGPAPLGYSSLLYLIAGAICARLRDVVLPDALTTRLTFGAAVPGVTVFITGLALARSGALAVSVVALVWKPLCTALLGALCTPPVFMAARAFDRGVGVVEERKHADDFT